MITISVDVQRNDHYFVQIEQGILTTMEQRFRNLGENNRVVIVTDDKVKNLYGNQLGRTLQNNQIAVQIITIPEGEFSKSLDVATKLIDYLVESGIKRRDILIALGGGVITDLVGFVAATFMRGIPYVNIPTTLLAQLDASIGGKVAVNHRYGKNLIGAFYHPSAVYIDPETLTTLPKEEIRNGLAEAIKVATIHSKELFEFIETHCEQLLQSDISLLAELITLTAKAKVELLEPDPYERDLKRVLNFGHSIGHVLETLHRYDKMLSHGQAISIGMAAATRIAAVRGICRVETAKQVLALLQKAGLPIDATEIDLSSFKDGLQIVKSIRDGYLNFVLPTNVGNCTILSDLSFDLIVQNLRGSNVY